MFGLTMLGGPENIHCLSFVHSSKIQNENKRESETSKSEIIEDSSI